VSWVTPGLTAAAGLRNKRPACWWLRSSSYNCADQSPIVIESLCENSELRPHFDYRSGAPSRARSPPRCGTNANGCLLKRGMPVLGWIDWRAGGSPKCPGKLRPLPELGLEYFVDIHADPTNAALIDLDLVQTRGRMGESLGRAPIVLPEVGAQAVMHRPVDRL